METVKMKGIVPKMIEKYERIQKENERKKEVTRMKINCWKDEQKKKMKSIESSQNRKRDRKEMKKIKKKIY